MSTLRHNLSINLVGNMERRSRRLAQASENLSRRHGRAMKMMQNATKRMARGIDRAGKLTIAAGGALIAANAKQVMDFDERIRAIGVGAKLSGDKLKEFASSTKDQIRTAAIKNRTSSSEITAALEAIVTKTGDLEFAKNNIENIAIAIRATGAAGSDIGAILSEFQKMGKKSPKVVMEMLNILATQGKEGAFVLKDVAKLGERLFAAYGPKNVKAVREMGAMLQFIRRGTGSSEQATTAMEAVIRVLNDSKKIKALQKKAGINVFDPEMAKKGIEQLRPLKDIIIEMIEASGGKSSLLSEVLDAEALKAFNDLKNQYNRGVDIRAEVDKLSNIDAGETLQVDSKEMAQTMNAALTSLKEVWMKFADENLSNRIQRLADVINEMDPNDINNFLTHVRNAAGGIIALYAATKTLQAGFAMFKGGKMLVDMFKGKGGLLERGGPANPMYVRDISFGKGKGKRGGRGRVSSAGTAAAAAGSGAGARGKTGARAFMKRGAMRAIPVVGQALGVAMLVHELQEDSSSTLQQKRLLQEAHYKKHGLPVPKNLQAPVAPKHVPSLERMQQAMSRHNAEAKAQGNALIQSSSQQSALAVVNKMRQTPGQINLSLKAQNGTSVTIDSIQDPTGFKIKGYNTVATMTGAGQ